MLCPLHQKLYNAYGDFQKIFEKCRLSDFFKNHETTALCTHENI